MMIILGVVFLLLLGGIWALNQQPEVSTSPTPEPTVVAWNYATGTVQSLTVQSLTSTVALQVQGDDWRITAPLAADADDVQVAQEATTLKILQASQKIGDNVPDLAQYGLTTPALTATLVLSGATTPQQSFVVGKQSVDGASYFINPVGTKAVYLVSNAAIEPLKTWLLTPPVAVPTPTPLPVTIQPTATNTPEGTPAADTTPAGPQAPTTTPTPASPAPPGSSVTPLGTIIPIPGISATPGSNVTPALTSTP